MTVGGQSFAASKRWEKHCNFNDICSHLDGMIASDGSLHRGTNQTSFSITSKYNKFVLHVADLFKNINIEPKIETVTIKENKYYTLRTHSYTEFNLLYDKWYPNGKKKLSHDCIIDDISMLYWFLGDGILKSHSIDLSTYAFDIYDLKHKAFEMCDWLDIYPTELRLYSTRDGPILSFCNAVVDRFLEKIGESPVECFEYKWDHKKWTKISNFLLIDRWDI